MRIKTRGNYMQLADAAKAAKGLTRSALNVAPPGAHFRIKLSRKLEGAPQRSGNHRAV